MKTKYKLSDSILRYLFPNVGTLLLIALVLFVHDAWAASAQEQKGPASPDAMPGVIAYQGTLLDISQQPVNGMVDITFRFYDDASGGNLLWEEQRSVVVSNGIFSENLGSIIPFPSTIWGYEHIFLGIQVGTDSEMTPREEVSFVPWAMQASLAYTVADGSITTDSIADGAVTIPKLDIGRYQFWRDGSTNVIKYISPEGQVSLDLSSCAPGSWCCDATDKLCYYATPGQDSQLVFNITGSPSMACTLLHLEDDVPYASQGFYYATNDFTTAPPFAGWGIILSNDGVEDIPVLPFTGFVWFCP